MIFQDGEVPTMKIVININTASVETLVRFIDLQYFIAASLLLSQATLLLLINIVNSEQSDGDSYSSFLGSQPVYYNNSLHSKAFCWFCEQYLPVSQWVGSLSHQT